ncbi:MAG TPA: 6-carboxytetrahydropterin synthase [Terriglobia bacterium]|nr:6-carboxytetrahydropterin synthase [Terriglobia bacterium]
MIYLTRRVEFSASHYYHNPAFSPDENRRIFGKCSNPHGHGHNYTLEVTVAGEVDPKTGMVLNVKDLKRLLQSEVLEPMDHKFLNLEVPEFASRIPTTENIAIEIWNRIAPKMAFGRLHRVRLYETSDLYVDYLGD